MGQERNSGFDAFVPLIDSGISAYIGSHDKCFSIVLYTCKGFNESKAVELNCDYFQITGEIESKSFSQSVIKEKLKV